MAKPLPRLNDDSRPYWDGCNRDELLFQRCTDCGKAQFYFRAICRHCQSQALSVEKSAGRGRIHACSLVFRAPSPAFETPYFVALIDLDEGFRMMTNLPGADPAEARPGALVEVEFEQREGQKVPQFRLLRDQA